MKHRTAQTAPLGSSILGSTTLAVVLAVGCGDDTSSDSDTMGVPTTAATDDSTGDDDDSTSGDATSDATSDGGSTSGTSTTTNTTTTSDPSSTGEDSGSSGSDTDTTTGGGVEPLACPAHDLGSTVPATWEDQTDFQVNELSATCGGAGSPDMAFTFTAPAAGPYSFDTYGSALDTVLYVLEGECAGEVLDCDDDGLGGGDSVVSVDLTEGQTVTVVVDGFGTFGDDFELHVTSGQISCPRADLGNTVPNTINDSSILSEDEFVPSCGSGTSGEFAYTFTAPSTGNFIFDTLGSSYNTVLSVFDGTCSETTELACNDNAASGVVQSFVDVDLTVGQTVTVVVGGSFGATGDLQLNVGQLAGTCPNETLGTVALPFTDTGSTAAQQNTKIGSCGGYSSPDYTYLWTAPATGTFVFDTEGSNYDTLLYVTDASCNGDEIACNNNVGFSVQWSQVAVDLTNGQTVAVTVDGNGASGNFTLNIEQLECPGPELTGALPLTETGSTAGLINNLYGGCGADGAPEQTFLWTAPATANYTFDTFGSSYDTVLYLLDGNTCGDDVIVCDDDENGLQSQVSADLTAGQEIIVVVDGYSSASGAFTLHITQN